MVERGWQRRLFSLSAVVPLGFFLLEHTWQNALAMRGQAAYASKAEAFAGIPLLFVLEIALVFAPLGYHAIYGLMMMREGIPSDSPYKPRSLAIANRGAALVALAFIVWHVWEYRVQAWRHGVAPSALYTMLVWQLSATWHGIPARAALYLAGVLATTFHFAVSGWGYGVTSGVFATPLQRKRAAYGCLMVGSLLFVVSAGTVISLATGVQLSESETTDTPCTKK